MLGKATVEKGQKDGSWPGMGLGGEHRANGNFEDGKIFTMVGYRNGVYVTPFVCQNPQSIQ